MILFWMIMMLMLVMIMKKKTISAFTGKSKWEKKIKVNAQSLRKYCVYTQTDQVNIIARNERMESVRRRRGGDDLFFLSIITLFSCIDKLNKFTALSLSFWIFPLFFGMESSELESICVAIHAQSVWIDTRKPKWLAGKFSISMN